VFQRSPPQVGEENGEVTENVQQMIVDGDIVIPDEIVSDPQVAGGATIGEPGAAADIDVEDLGCTDAFRADLGL
jgi:hypothetical protein